MRMSEHLRFTFPEYFGRLDGILSEFWIAIMAFLAQFENVEKSGVCKNHAIDHLSEDERKSLFYNGWRKITRLTEEGKDTAALQSIFLALFAKEIVVSCEKGTVKITPRLEDALDYIREFCLPTDEGKVVFVVDSYQPSVNFDALFGQKVRHELWGDEGDPLHTNIQQLIVCDTAHWGSVDFLKDLKLQDKTRSFVNQVLEVFPPNKVLVVTTNRPMADIVRKWNPPEEIRVTYYRSDWMRGVSVEDRRIMICIGGPYIPKKAYDASAKSFRIESFAEDLELLDGDARTTAISKILRLDDTKSEFINSIGRVKDPAGRERSVVFTLGMQRHEVHLLLRQDAPVSKPNLTRSFRYGGMLRDGVWIAKLWFDRSPHGYLHIDLKDLPLLARIISRTRNKTSIRASEIVPHKTDLVTEKAKHYENVLSMYNVRLVRKRGGISFQANYATLNHFSNEKGDQRD